MKTNTHSNKKPSGKGGFTLPEVIIGVIIFAFVATALFRVIDQGFRIMESARDFTRITQILQYQTETLRGTSWDDLTNLVGTASVDVNAYGIPSASTDEVPFAWQSFNMTQTITSQNPTLLSATLTATWKNRKGSQKTRSFETLIAKDGLNAYYIRTAS